MSVLDNLKAANATAKASGTFPIIKNSANGKMKKLKLFGKSTQNGTPTKANPIDVVTAGSGGNIVVSSCGKNLANIADFTLTNPDTRTIAIAIKEIKAGTYHLNINLSGTASRVSARFEKRSGASTTYPNKNLVNGDNILTCDGEADYIYFYIPTDEATGTTAIFNNIMLSFEGGEYEPYKTPTTAEISTPEGLASVGDVRDEIIKYADGSGKHIQRVGKIYSRNVSVVYTSSLTNPNGNVYIIPCSSWEKEILWTHRNKGQSVSTLTKDQYYVGQNENSASGKVIYFISSATTTASALAEIQAENSEIYYILLNPVETALSAAQMLELNKLRTFDSITCVSNDAGAEMEIEYFKNSKIGQEMSDIHAGVPRFILDGTTLNIIV